MNYSKSDEFYINLSQQYNDVKERILKNADADKKKIDDDAQFKIHKFKTELFQSNFNEDECIAELEKWFQLAEEKCYQGGNGHRISWNFIPFQFARKLKKLNPHYIYNAPHNWMCSENDYPIMKLSHKLQGFTEFHGSNIQIDDKLSMANWS